MYILAHIDSLNLGTLNFDLNAMPEPVSEPSLCILDQIEKPIQTSDLFKRMRMKGWWPAYKVDNEGNKLLNVSSCFSYLIVLPAHASEHQSLYMYICSYNKKSNELEIRFTSNYSSGRLLENKQCQYWQDLR